MDWDVYAEQLRTSWDSLDSATRAKRIDNWAQSGKSVRELAKRLGRSESGLRKTRSSLNVPNKSPKKPK